MLHAQRAGELERVAEYFYKSWQLNDLEEVK